MPDPNDDRFFNLGGQQIRAWSPEFREELGAYSPMWNDPGREQRDAVAAYISGASETAPKASEFFVGYDSEDSEKQRLMTWMLDTLLSSRDFHKPKNYKGANPNDEEYNQLTRDYGLGHTG